MKSFRRRTGQQIKTLISVGGSLAVLSRYGL